MFVAEPRLLLCVAQRLATALLCVCTVVLSEEVQAPALCQLRMALRFLELVRQTRTGAPLILQRGGQGGGRSKLARAWSAKDPETRMWER